MSFCGFQREAVKGKRSTPYFPFDFEATWIENGRSTTVRFREDDDLDDAIESLSPGGELRAELPLRVGHADGTSEEARLFLTITRVRGDRGTGTRFRGELGCRGGTTFAEADDWLDEVFRQLRVALWPNGWLICCAGCRWSRNGPSTGWGEISCYVSDREKYERLATSSDAYVVKYHRPAIDVPGRDLAAECPHGVPTDELYCCDEYTPRPPGFGYSG